MTSPPDPWFVWVFAALLGAALAATLVFGPNGLAS